MSIRTKLILLAVVSVSIALGLCSIGLVTTDVRVIRKAKVRELESLANILGFNSTAVLSFHDAPAASRLLASLGLEPMVTCGCLYDSDGKVLALYSPSGRKPPPLTNSTRAFHQMNAMGELELLHPVTEDGELLGNLYLSSSMADFHDQMRSHLVVVATVMIGALLASVLVSVKLQSSISGPLLKLAVIAKKVSADKDYSVRIEHEASDEVGTMCEAFDHMLTQIQSSQTALCAAHDELEDRVRQRTSQLQQEIARRERVQADLEQAKNAAEAASRTKSQFLANMSHEIRTPLNAILGFTELLRQGADGSDTERCDFLETIHTSGKHLLSLIDDILDLSRIEANRLEIKRAPCSPNALLVETISVLRVRATQKGLYLRLRWETPMPAAIQTDSFRLCQLLVNLLGNAIKFTRSGGVTVIARLLPDRPKPQLQIDVTDTGVGIAADKLEVIFNPFVQADSSVTREFGGSGLGLAISRRMVEALGGEISVLSEVGKGSTFTVTIDTGPLEGVELLEPVLADGVAENPRSTEERTAWLPPVKILLVEDGDTNRKLISVILSRAGAQVTTAENGQIAVDLACQQDFAAILMDMQMPVMDGYTAARQLRQRGIGVPIIALTAHAMKGDEEKCRAAGCSGYLTKPVGAGVLLRAVAQALDMPGGKTDGEKSNPADRRIVSSLPTDDPDFRTFVEEFAGRLPGQIEAMQRSWEARQSDALARGAHWLAGTGGTVGFDQFTIPARRLEQMAKAAQWEEAGLALGEIVALAKLVWLPWREQLAVD